MKVTALFKNFKGGKAAPAKKVLSSGKKTGGWLGADSQNLGLDKYVH